MKDFDLSKAFLDIMETSNKSPIEKSEILKDIDTIFQKYVNKPVTVKTIVYLQNDIYSRMKDILKKYKVDDDELLDLLTRFNNYISSISEKIK